MCLIEVGGEKKKIDKKDQNVGETEGHSRRGGNNGRWKESLRQVITDKNMIFFLKTEFESFRFHGHTDGGSTQTTRDLLIFQITILCQTWGQTLASESCFELLWDFRDS